MSERSFILRLFSRQPKAERKPGAAGGRHRRRKGRKASPAEQPPRVFVEDSSDRGSAEPWYRQSGPLFDESFNDGPASPGPETSEPDGEQSSALPTTPGAAAHVPPHVPMIQRIEEVAVSPPHASSVSEQEAALQAEPDRFAPPSNDEVDIDDNGSDTATATDGSDDTEADTRVEESLAAAASAEDPAQHDPPMVVPVRGYYLTRSDDTLRSVAAQFLNEPTRWSELRAINAAQPGISDAYPDELLEPGTALALPGDPLPWGRPDPVYLWTLAETFLYTAWGREPSPEEVVPFWRGLTRGALPEGEQLRPDHELPGIAEIEARGTAAPLAGTEDSTERLLPPPFEMPAADEPAAAEPSPLEAPAEEPAEPLEPGEDDSVDNISSASSAGPDTADDADETVELTDDAEPATELAPDLPDEPEDSEALDIEAEAAVTMGATFDPDPADSITGADPFHELVETVEQAIETAVEDESIGVDDAETAVALEAGVIAPHIDDEDIVDATIIEDTSSDDHSDETESLDDTLADEPIAETEIFEDDQIVDEIQIPDVSEPESALEPPASSTSVQAPPVVPPAPPIDSAYGVGAPSLEPPPTFEDWLSESDATSPSADPSAPYAGLPAAGSAHAPAMPPEAEAPRVPHFLPSVTGSIAGQQPPVARSTPLGRSLAGTAVGDAMMLWQLARRRHHSQRGAGATDAIEQALQLTAGSESLQLIETAMRHLYAVTVGQQRTKPSVLAVRVGTYGFEVLLDKPIETPPGWRSASGGFVLELPQGVTARDLSAIGQGPSLCPALVPVGNTFEGPLLLNLEQLGCLAISGPSGPAASLLSAVVSALGSSPMASDLRITAVGLDNAAGMIGWEAVRFANYDAPELEALMASTHGPGDGAVELLVIGPGNDLLIQRAGQVATAPGSRLSLVGATSAVSARWPWRLHVDDTGTAVVHPISITMTAARALPPEILAQLGGMASGSAGPAGPR